jgi:hypothetical protein
VTGCPPPKNPHIGSGLDAEHMAETGEIVDPREWRQRALDAERRLAELVLQASSPGSLLRPAVAVQIPTDPAVRARNAAYMRQLKEPPTRPAVAAFARSPHPPESRVDPILAQKERQVGAGDKPAAAEAVTPAWRTGRKVGRTIYDANDQLIGVMDRAEDAARVVAAVNGRVEQLTAAESEAARLQTENEQLRDAFVSASDAELGLHYENNQLRAELAKTRAVVEAAKAYLGTNASDPDCVLLNALERAVKALRRDGGG